MILTGLSLHQFGCFTGKVLSFKEGLNVIVGPNESGKSTAFQAIQKVLFTPVKLTKTHFEKEMARYLPLGRGDFIEVELSFLVDGVSYMIRRRWGKIKNAQLAISDGRTFIDDETITNNMDHVLPVKPGTFKSVLMAYQSGLTRTVNELMNEHADTIRTLGDILRKTIMETDGVSVDKFKDTIQALYSDYFSHWDALRQYPERDRGIENPWQKEVGHVLRAFYEKEKVRILYEEAEEHEDRLDRINSQIHAISQTVSEKDGFVKNNKKTYDDSLQRRTLEAETKALNIEIDTLSKVNSDWPVRENKVEEAKTKIPQLEEALKPLEQEKKDALEAQKNRDIREKYKKAKEKNAYLQGKFEELQRVKILSDDDLNQIKEALSERDKIKGKITAGKLTLMIKAKTSFNMHISKDFDEEYSQEICPDSPSTIEAGGLIRLGHRDWDMEIISGKGNINKLKEEYETAEVKLSDVFKKHGVETLEETTHVNAIYNRCKDKVIEVQNILKDVLGDETFDVLESKVKELGEEKKTRPVDEIVTEYEKAKNDVDNLRKDVQAHEKVLKEYTDKYKDKNQLLLTFAKSTGKLDEVQIKVNELSSLPDGFSDSDNFIEAYEKIRDELEKEKERLNNKLIEKAGLEASAPESSSEELSTLLKEMEENFERTRKKGEAIALVKETTGNLLNQLDVGTYDYIRKDVEHYVAAMTDNRYDKVAMDGAIPVGFFNKEGNVLECDLLSVGTKDVLSLAIRLAMANYFLKDTDGFLVLDDPLVDLDPVRQQRAAELLKAYAKAKQIIVFTCHPSHADLFEGNRIAL